MIPQLSDHGGRNLSNRLHLLSVAGETCTTRDYLHAKREAHKEAEARKEEAEARERAIDRSQAVVDTHLPR